MGYIYGPFFCYNDGKLEVLLLGDSLGTTDVKVLGYDEGINLVSTDGEVIVNILVNLDGITLGVDVGIYLGSLDGSYGGYNDGKLERLFIADSLSSTDGKVLGYDEGIIMRSTDGKLLVTILENVDGITFDIDFGKELGSIDRPIYGSNDGKLEIFLLGDSLVPTDGKVLCPDEGIKLGSTDGEVLGTILGDVDVPTLEIDVGTDLVSLDESFDGSNNGQVEGLLL